MGRVFADFRVSTADQTTETLKLQIAVVPGWMFE